MLLKGVQYLKLECCMKSLTIVTNYRGEIQIFKLERAVHEPQKPFFILSCAENPTVKYLQLMQLPFNKEPMMTNIKRRQ